MLDVVFQNTTDDKSFRKDLFEKIIKVGITELGLDTKNIDISINLVGEEKIRELNKKYRNKDQVTDVLSFPMLKDSNLETRDKKQVKSEILVSGRLSLVADIGDIFICLPFAKKEAKSENIDIDRKLAQLTVHGFLHLMGYDHELSKLDAEKMSGLEKRILKNL